MVCVNQPLLDELAVLIKWKLIGEDHKEYGVVETHSLAYKRACAVSSNFSDAWSFFLRSLTSISFHLLPYQGYQG